MLDTYPFPHNTHVYVVSDDRFEVAYYGRDYLKFKRTRELGVQTWLESPEQEITRDEFWMIVACLERRSMI